MRDGTSGKLALGTPNSGTVAGHRHARLPGRIVQEDVRLLRPARRHGPGPRDDEPGGSPGGDGGVLSPGRAAPGAAVRRGLLRLAVSPPGVGAASVPVRWSLCSDPRGGHRLPVLPPGPAIEGFRPALRVLHATGLP